MVNPKRQRQKEGRMIGAEQRREQEKRNQRMRQIRALVLVVVAILGVALLISILGRDDDDQVATEDTTEDTTDQTEADVPEAEPPAAAEPDDYSDPDVAQEVFDRGPPADVEGAPEDLDPDALEIETVIEGSGPEVEPGDLVVVHYYGVLSDGTRFDDSWSRGEPFPTTIPGQLIDGWNEGLIGAQLGERRRLDIGSDLAYGDSGSGTIPPGAPLAFVIDVVDITSAGDG
jgi:peptidylprolyl isomerase